MSFAVRLCGWDIMVPNDASSDFDARRQTLRKQSDSVPTWELVSPACKRARQASQFMQSKIRVHPGQVSHLTFACGSAGRVYSFLLRMGDAIAWVAGRVLGAGITKSLPISRVGSSLFLMVEREGDTGLAFTFVDVLPLLQLAFFEFVVERLVKDPARESLQLHIFRLLFLE